MATAHRERRWDTRVRSMQLRVPRVRDGGYFPTLLEPRRAAASRPARGAPAPAGRLAAPGRAGGPPAELAPPGGGRRRPAAVPTGVQGPAPPGGRPPVRGELTRASRRSPTGSPIPPPTAP